MAKVSGAKQKTARKGVALTGEEAAGKKKKKNEVLKRQRRVEFGAGIIEKLIYEFCDSAYLDSSNYVETIIRLQEIFYCYKNEMPASLDE